MKYLIFETLPFAITGAIYIYWNFMRKKQVPKKENTNPVELKNGKYSLEKPNDKYMAGVEYSEITETINKK